MFSFGDKGEGNLNLVCVGVPKVSDRPLTFMMISMCILEWSFNEFEISVIAMNVFAKMG